jgi:hypothetical protein
VVPAVRREPAVAQRQPPYARAATPVRLRLGRAVPLAPASGPVRCKPRGGREAPQEFAGRLAGPPFRGSRLSPGPVAAGPGGGAQYPSATTALCRTPAQGVN